MRSRTNANLEHAGAGAANTKNMRFWIHVAQALIFAALAILAFHRLARVTALAHAVGDNPIAKPQGSTDFGRWGRSG